jgi:ABC-type dipeptide/oligopeptide/nickel transport system ATPase component
LISHDLSLVGQVSDFVAVMHQGRIVEQGTRQQVFAHPQHTQTLGLLDSAGKLERAFRSASAGGT